MQKGWWRGHQVDLKDGGLFGCWRTSFHAYLVGCPTSTSLSALFPYAQGDIDAKPEIVLPKQPTATRVLPPPPVPVTQQPLYLRRQAQAQGGYGHGYGQPPAQPQQPTVAQSAAVQQAIAQARAIAARLAAQGGGSGPPGQPAPPGAPWGGQ